jgi:hypothetical protein
MDYKLDPLDLPVFGAAEMARILNIVDDDGELDIRRMFYMLEKKYVDADKLDRRKKEANEAASRSGWVSTPRRLLATFISQRQRQHEAA